MLTVHPTNRQRGILRFDGREYPCALGRNGVRATKREGDGATPLGIFPLRSVLYRPDRIAPPPCRLSLRALAPADGWCDDPDHEQYNRLVALPFAGSHEVLWRTDGLYDIVIVIGHNDDPPRPRRGSAIFVHCATPDFAPTEGCIALDRQSLVGLLPQLEPEMALRILAR